MKHSKSAPTIYPDGSKYWFLDGKLHRIDGPAYEGADGSKCWYFDGKRHRTDGPAVERPDGTKEFWVVGMQVHLTEKEFREALFEMNERKSTSEV